MPIDQVENFVLGDVSSSIASGDTTISVPDASIYPDPSNGEYNIVVWDAERPALDPNVEIVRVTARDTMAGTLTVTRGQENTTAADHPGTSEMQLSPTAKTIEDIESDIGSKADDPHDNTAHSTNYSAEGHDHSGETINPDSVNAGAVDITNQTSVRVELTADQPIASGSPVPLSLAVDQDNLGEWNTSTDEFVPDETGEYFIDMAITFTASSSGDDLSARFSSTGGDIKTYSQSATTSTVGKTLTASKKVQLQSGTSYQLLAQNRDSSDTVQGDTFATYVTIWRSPE